MTNGTPGTVNRFTQAEWIAAEAFNCLAMLCVIWVSVSFLVYGNRTGMWRKSPRANDGLMCARVYTCYLLCSLPLLPHYVVNQVVFNVGYGANETSICSALAKLSTALYTLAIVGMYLVMWLRQHRLLQLVSEIRVVPGWMQALKWSTLFVVIAGGVTSVVSYTAAMGTVGSNRGCVPSYSEIDTNSWSLKFAFSTTFVAQLLLVLLFLLPLRFQLQGSKNARRVLKVFGRSAAAASVVVVSSFVAIYLAADLKNATRHVTYTLFDVILFVTYVCVLSTFGPWRKIVTCLLACRGSADAVFVPV